MTDKKWINMVIAVFAVVLAFTALFFPSSPDVQKNLDGLRGYTEKYSADTTNNSFVLSWLISDYNSFKESINSRLDEISRPDHRLQEILAGDVVSRMEAAESAQRKLRTDMQYVQSKLMNLENLGSLDQSALDKLYKSFDDICRQFALLEANKDSGVEVTNVIVTGTVYKGSDVLLADVIVVVENRTIYDLNNVKLSLTLRADGAIPTVQSASIGGFVVGTSWTYQFQENEYLFFESAPAFRIPAGSMLGLDLKLKITFPTALANTVSFTSKVTVL